VPAGRLPTFCIVGAQKAGTTSLATWLGAHPDVFVPEVKEVSYFNDPFNFWRGPDWYRSHFAAAGDVTAVGDATPLMQNALAVQHLSELLPDARLVAVLRHPVDRTYSHYQHLRATGVERRSFDRAIRAELTLPARTGGQYYLQRSEYLPQLQEIVRHYPRDALLVVLFDDLVGKSEETYAAVCRHIGVDEQVRPDVVGSNRNPRPGYRHPALERLPLPPAARDRVRRWNAGNPRPYPPLAAAARARLCRHFAPGVRALGDWLGRDLSAWLA
jgi:hypothetical protein